MTGHLDLVLSEVDSAMLLSAQNAVSALPSLLLSLHLFPSVSAVNVTVPTASPTTDKTPILEDPGALAGIGVAAFVVPFIATALIGLLIGYYCFKEDKGKKPRTFYLRLLCIPSLSPSPGRLPDDKSAPTSHDDKSCMI